MDEMPSIKGKLNLPELQIASFRTDYRVLGYKDYSFELKCPKLKALRLLFYKPVLTCETDRLEYLDYCDYCDYQDGADYLSNISPNLRKLSTICIEPECPEWPLLSLLQSGGLVLPSLSEIQIELRELPSLEELDKMANNLRDLKQDARTKHIKVIFIGKLINSSNEISRITSLIQTNLSMAGLETPLNDRSFLFLSRTPELEFLLSATCVVQFNEDIECTEEMIKKLKNVKFLNFTDHFKPSVSTFELFARNCKSLKWLNLRNQMVTGRLLEMLSGYLLDLKGIKILASKYETLKPLVKFKNLEAIGLDFNPPRDELTFIFKKSQNLEQVFLYGKHHLELLRTITAPKLHRIFVAPAYRNPPKFGTLSSMIAYYYENHLFKQPENYETSTRLIKKKRQAKIPDAAVEMPSSYRTVSLNVRFGDFGSDPSKTNDDQITREQESFMNSGQVDDANSGQHSMNMSRSESHSCSHSTNSMYPPNLQSNGSMNVQPLGMWPAIQIACNPVGQSLYILTGIMPFLPNPVLFTYQPTQTIGVDEKPPTINDQTEELPE